MTYCMIRRFARVSVRKVRSVFRVFRRTWRFGRTGLILALSGEAWKLLLGHVISVVYYRSAPDTTRVAKEIQHHKGNLSAMMLFVVGDFRAAMTQALSDLDSRPDDVRTRMLVIGCAIELGDFERGENNLKLLDGGEVPDDVSRQLPFFRYAFTKEKEPHEAELAVRHLDDLYSAMGCRPIRMDWSCNQDVFESLTSLESAAPVCQDGYPPLYDGPLVSVIMTAYNVEDLVETSIMSILNQNYRNLELIVVDDCSTDGTLEALRLLEGEDARLQVIAKDRNDGTYVSKNTGLLRAEGEYVAFQDSDDWSHPDRIGKSIAVLASEPEIVALTTNWVRMTTEGNLILRKHNRYSYKACISLITRRKEILQRAGFFDSVRAAADSEFESRISILFGENRVVNYPWPLAFGRVRYGSITANIEYGLARGKGRPAREEYHKSYRKWHGKIGRGHNGYMPFPLRERPFDAPGAILAESK